MPKTMITWVDDKQRGRAVIFKGRQPVVGSDVSEAFSKVRAAGAVCRRGAPLIVYGTHCTSAESATFRFEQLTEPQVRGVIATLRGQLVYPSTPDAPPEEAV